MSCKKSPNDIFFLSNLPHNGFKHSIDCPFYNHIENLTDSEDRYKDLIFKELNYLDFSKATEEETKEYNEKNAHRKNTFNSFCIDMISESISKAFNISNSGTKERDKLVYPKCKTFLNCFSYLINNNIFLSKGSIKDSLDEKSSFYYGVIEDNILEQLNEFKKEYSIILPSIKKEFNDEGKFINYKILDFNFNISKRNLESTAQLVKNFNHFIKHPYFFMAVVKKNKIVRFFIKPVYFNKEYIVFVDSGYERNYSKTLLDDKKPFIKPLKNSCFSKIRGELVNYKINEDVSKRAFLQFIPDFIEFEKENIIITEVSGYENEDYQNHLKRKEKHYHKESRKSKEFYKYKNIKGK